MTTTPRPADWKDYDDFSSGIDTNRLPPTDALAGREVELALTCGGSVACAFDGAAGVSWRADFDQLRGAGEDRYEAIEVAEDTYFVDIDFDKRPRQALTLVLVMRTGWALAVLSTVLPDEDADPSEPQVVQDFLPGRLAGSEAPRGPQPAPTRDLIGKRMLYRYSPNHLYEHIYLSSQRYAWQNLVGVQRGHGDTDLATTYKVDDDLYLFTFREFKIPVASVFVYNMKQRRSTGKFLGVTGDGRIENTRAGAHILPNESVLAYPEGEEPV